MTPIIIIIMINVLFDSFASCRTPHSGEEFFR
jgi:hypothetical protein